MRVEVDRDLCQGHAMCVLEAPGVFELDEDIHQVRILEEHPEEARRAAVENAVEYCPTMALRIVEDGDEQDEAD